MNSKEKYRKLCSQVDSIPLFSKDWWLDAVCGLENWNAIVIEKGGVCVGALPFYCKKKFGFKIATMPTMTPFFEFWIRYPEGQKYSTKLAYEKNIMEEVIKKFEVEGVDCIDFFLGYSFVNWLPFFWKGFKQTTVYSYVIEDLSNMDKTFLSFESKIKTGIKKAEKIVNIKEDCDIGVFYKVNRKTFTRQKLTMPFSLEYLKTLDKVCSEKGCRKILYAEDAEKNIHAAIYLVWDEGSVYYLIGGSDPKFLDSRAFSLLMWEAIKFASSLNKKFDFEGSWVESIERFFRAFGAVQKPYFKITKSYSFIFNIKEALLCIIKK